MDIHHSNGTQDIFFENEKIQLSSIHQWPFYPGTGSEKEKGKFNNILNIPMEAGTNSDQYLNAYDRVLKKLKAFNPDFVLMSFGVDGHELDPIGQFKLKSKDYYTITKRTLEIVKECCDGKFVSILEGGYSNLALQESTDEHTKALLEYSK